MPYDCKRIREARSLHSHNKLVANALHRAVRRRQLRVASLALKAGVPLRGVQRILDGHIEKVSFWTMARLAKALKLDLNYLAGLNPEQKGRPHGFYTTLD